MPQIQPRDRCCFKFRTIPSETVVMKCTKCKKKPATKGFKSCKVCRTRQAAARRSWLAKHPEVNRENMTKIRASTTPSALAYKARHQVSRRAAERKWAAKNRDRKDLIAALGVAIKSGEIIKPTRCQDCKKAKSPLVAFGLSGGGDGLGVEVQAFCCWGCWWKRRRGQGPACAKTATRR